MYTAIKLLTPETLAEVALEHPIERRGVLAALNSIGSRDRKTLYVAGSVTSARQLPTEVTRAIGGEAIVNKMLSGAHASARAVLASRSLGPAPAPTSSPNATIATSEGDDRHAAIDAAIARGLLTPDERATWARLSRHVFDDLLAKRVPQRGRPVAAVPATLTRESYEARRAEIAKELDAFWRSLDAAEPTIDERIAKASDPVERARLEEEIAGRHDRERAQREQRMSAIAEERGAAEAGRFFWDSLGSEGIEGANRALAQRADAEAQRRASEEGDDAERRRLIEGKHLTSAERASKFWNSL